MTHRPTTILAIDPGLRELGYAILQGSRIASAGVLPLRLSPKSRRRLHAQRTVQRWIRDYRPDVVVVEQSPAHPVPWLHELHRLSCAIHRMASARGAAFASYAATSVRKSVVGDGWATKCKVAEVLAARYPALRVYLTADKRWKERYWLNLFDALALAIHHRTRR